MPSPVTPSQLKEAIPSVTGNFCERFLKALTQPKLWYDIVKWMITEDGAINPDGMGIDICALNCFGATGPSGGTGTVFGYPQNVSATDGSYMDRVVITWNAVYSATHYDVYRNTVNNTSTATLIGTSTGTSLNDTTAEAGTNYYYWVRARNNTQTSGYSQPDQGYRAGTMTAVTDLAATKGFSFPVTQAPPFINLVFSPVEGANEYDFYISDTNDFNDAELLDASRTPFNNKESIYECYPAPCTKPIFLDNDGELVYNHKPADPADYYVKKYFWVIAKATSNGLVTAMSAESNSAEGWAVGIGDGVSPLQYALVESGGAEVDMIGTASKAWVVLYGCGAGGAGGDGDDGGGGGGGGAMVVGWINVAVGSKIRVVSVPEADTGNASSGTNGASGNVTVVEYSANGLFTDTVTIMGTTQPTGGQFINGGLGAGGTKATGLYDATVNDPVTFDGRDGMPAEASGVGGRGGHRFGGSRRQGAHWNGFIAQADPGNGDYAGAGGGSYKSPGVPSLATGGKGMRGYAVIVQFA